MENDRDQDLDSGVVTQRTEDSAEQRVLGVTESITVEGHHDAVTTDARMDTGASRSVIDTELTCSLGAVLHDSGRSFRSGTGSEDRHLVELAVEIRGVRRDIEASMTDRSNMSTNVRLGRDALAGFRVEVPEEP